MYGIFDSKISVKIPADVERAAKSLPDFANAANRMTGEVSAFNVTLQTVAVAVILGGILAVLLLRK